MEEHPPCLAFLRESGSSPLRVKVCVLRVDMSTLRVLLSLVLLGVPVALTQEKAWNYDRCDSANGPSAWPLKNGGGILKSVSVFAA